MYIYNRSYICVCVYIYIYTHICLYRDDIHTHILLFLFLWRTLTNIDFGFEKWMLLQQMPENVDVALELGTG